MSLAGFRKGAQQVIDGGKKGGRGGGRKGNWRMKWKPPHQTPGASRQVAEPVVFTEAEYNNTLYDKDTNKVFQRVDPFYYFRKHTFKRPGGRGPKGIDIKEVVCSAGVDPHAPQQCVPCYMVDHGTKGSDARDNVAFNLAHLMPYHSIPLRDKQTQNIIFKKDDNGNPTQDPVLVEEQCSIQGCVYCQQNQQYQQNFYPIKFGAQRIMELGTGHLGTILGLDAKVGLFCANCMTNIKLEGYCCKQCKATILDVATCGWKNEQIDQFGKQPYQCQNCGYSDLPEEEIDCGYDPQGFYKLNGRGCPEDVAPRRLTLFDCVFYLQREGTDAQTKIVDVSWVRKDQFQTPDGRPLDDHLKEIVKAPFNFAEFYKPDTTEGQAKLLNTQNPYMQQGPGYGPPQQGYAPQGQQGYGPPPPQYPMPPGAQPQFQPPGYPPQAPAPQYPQQAPQQQPAPTYPNIPVPGRPNYS